jgi:diacylglycerol kinase (ATP)
MRAVLFHNPKAGSAEHSKETLLAALELAGISASYCSTKSADFDECRRMKADLFVVAGGDGTVAKVIAELPNRTIPIGIFPIGTANNIARSLGISGTPIELAEILTADHTTVRLDIGSADGPWGLRNFVEAVGLGPIARSLKKRPRGKLTGAENLKKGRQNLQRLIIKSKPLDLEIVIDGQTLKGDILAVEVLNVAFTGPALSLAPDADAGDGKFDIVYLPTGRREEMSDWLESPHEEPPPLEVCQGKKIAITGKLPYQRIDDEVFEEQTEQGSIAIDMEHEAAKIVVRPPKETGASKIDK